MIQILPDNSKIYATGLIPLLDSSVSVIDTASGKVVKDVPVDGPGIAVVSVSHDGRYVYVQTASSMVDVIDTRTDTVIRRIALLAPPSLGSVTVSSDDRTLYVGSQLGFITQYDGPGSVSKPGPSG